MDCASMGMVMYNPTHIPVYSHPHMTPYPPFPLPCRPCQSQASSGISRAFLRHRGPLDGGTHRSSSVTGRRPSVGRLGWLLGRGGAMLRTYRVQDRRTTYRIGAEQNLLGETRPMVVLLPELPRSIPTMYWWPGLLVPAFVLGFVTTMASVVAGLHARSPKTMHPKGSLMSSRSVDRSVGPPSIARATPAWQSLVGQCTHDLLNVQ